MTNADIEYIEFTNSEARDTRVKGSRRLLVITRGSVVSGLAIKGEAIDGNGLFTISEVTVPTPTLDQFKSLLLESAKAAR